jgi:hypothetical protein
MSGEGSIGPISGRDQPGERFGTMRACPGMVCGKGQSLVERAFASTAAVHSEAVVTISIGPVRGHSALQSGYSRNVKTTP